ncbi:sigma-E factor regulatory protein RseB [Edwardsiella piscicida]|uniref:Sigma factor RpoE negative regulatory protein RseB n=3 Tax=Edwardsiella TaxID=635 RepID=A0A0H3DV86_EDWTF|nr:sigma-E factor regulatory protein RseB [Edwardsiella piscicida]ACY85561.1 sigma E regulatory protein [Edwardsiella tarda EIB202]ADM42563.1 Sigma factor RpoE negative regulatory protein RseB precursor [Edwardsiella tarda FL6-60]AGH74757.1 anti-sigma E factor [Edwardsiella piscicida C07-087]AOP43969.1 sigma-E factor regulatory protein RseB [Edwardsiella piscicida]EKS7766326.1 sigma-E factor regulatory protein RseB [Edwardsiella piscicida]
MKHIWFALSLLTGSLFISSSALAQDTAPGLMLQQMNKASQSLNYELAFINITKQGVESLRYRHALENQQALAQLLQMDGPRREVVLRGNEVSYFEPGLEPFTLTGDHIVDALPSVIFADINQLAPYYNFISVGRTRVADRPCEVIRVVSRDGMRFSYIVWIDEDSKLPLRVDLLDRDGETLEQFRVIAFDVGQQVANEMRSFSRLTLPPLLRLPPAEHVSFSWRTAWVPDGFKEVSRSRRTLPSLSEPVESRLYSDGLFSFSVNVSPTTGDSRDDQFLRQGRRTIHTETRNNAEISVVGELPPMTAKRIAASIRFSR